MEYGNGPTNELVWKTVHNRYHNEDFQVHEDNLNVNVAMLSQYIHEGDTVLDIGCGEGKFGAVLRNKNCSIYGIDLDKKALEIALKKNNYKKGFVFNIEAPSFQDSDYCEFNKEQILFDDIALIDILEHVINPTQVIWNSVKYLKDEGSILVSVPNVNNADILLNLMRDHFNYRADGVLDNTHTKYFTKRSFAEWIYEINECSDFTLDCEYVGSTYGYTDYLEEVKKRTPNVYQFIQLNPYFHVIQHLFLLKYYKNKNNEKMVNLKMLFQEKGVDLSAELELLLQNQGISVPDNMKFSMLTNERKIMEEQLQSANTGWADCADELGKAKIRIDKLEAELLTAKEFMKKQEQAIQELNSANREIEAKWKECSTALQAADDGWRECAEALERAKAGWEECAKALQEAKEQLGAKDGSS